MSARTMLRTTVSHGALLAGLAVAAAGPAASQSPVVQTADTTSLPTLSVEGVTPPNTLQAPTGITRLPGTVQDTPQTITVVPPEVLRQQNVTTLEQALRNVPGITVSTGEGNGGTSGDQFRLRGFNAQNDVYVDGLRDFGAFQRDAFTYESVSVLQGPSGFALGGAGTVGGAISVTSRTPTLGNRYSGVVTGGMGPFARGTADINVQTGESSAVRLNLMGQSSSVVDRDEIRSRRWGVAPSVAVGLGTDTTLSIEYLHYHYSQTPDTGVPVVTPPGQVGRPITEFGVRRSAFVGSEGDYDRADVDRLTARLSHRATDWLTLSNDFRTGWTERENSRSIVGCGGATAATATAAAVPYARSCTGILLSGGSPTVTAGGAGNPYRERTWGIQNVATAVARFNTGPLRHELVAGGEVFHQDFDRTGYAITGTRAPINLRDPYNGFDYGRGAASNRRDSDETQLALFASDRIWLIPELSVIGGLRYTHSEVDYTAGTPGLAPTTNTSVSDSFVDPRASIVWEPAPNQTYYFTYSSSTTAPGVNFTTLPGTVTTNVVPERNRLYEVGARYGLFDNRLGLSAALFRIEKNNALETDPITGNVFQTSDRQRNQGVQLGITGRITEAWNINASYVFLDSDITRSTTAANVGNRVQFAARHAGSVWTTYDIAAETPYNVTLGAGVTVRSPTFLNAANSQRVPTSFSLDALVSHRINDNLRVSVNGYNLTNRLNYDTFFSNRATPSAGRTVLASLSFDF